MQFCSWPISFAARKREVQIPLAGDAEGDLCPLQNKRIGFREDQDKASRGI